MTRISELLFVALRCRCPTLRRRAVALLWSRNWLEGCWWSFNAARTAERVIAIEEADPLETCQQPSDIPALNRIRVIKMHKVPSPMRGGRILLRYVRRPWDLTGLPEESCVDVPCSIPDTMASGPSNAPSTYLQLTERPRM